MSLSRRGFLVSSSAALGAAWAGAGLSGCASSGPRVASPAPGVHRVALGGLTLTTLSDGYFSRPLDGAFVRNAPLPDVQAALRDAGLPTDKLEVPFNPVVADLGGQRILFDVGNGEFGAPTAGRLLANMAAAGIAPESITAVVFSHFHGDHINGLRNKAGNVVFPRAKIFVPAPEWAFWMDDARMAAAPEGMKGAFAATRRVFAPLAASVTRFEPGAEVLPGVRSVAAFGHTPGHTAFEFEGGSRKALYWGDTTNVAALFVRNPDWAVMFDMDPAAARQVRHRLCARIVSEDMVLAGYHLSGSAIGTLATRGNGYDFTPFVA
jgi:glyoxylase-like metal-dependent hydrolase (beta-lactamase superfamily II)